MGEEFTKKTYRLKERHNWKARPGHLICVIDRGAIRFDYPETWDLTVDEGQINVRDRPAPTDDCVLSVSRMYLPFELADHVPLGELVQTANQDMQGQGEVLEQRPVEHVRREDGLELAYAETRYLERKEQREAYGRLAVARGAGVYCLITFSCWADQLGKFDPVWREALRSLTLGLYATDPTIGPVVQ
jgi:hypothetical protein